ncbi:MAG: D-tyrosyl-tRNA(Tyr) deacylase [Rikenellaceae bacterium]|jgi:D-tyrosyl-tRNA(Tyr) deacylase|nr:D-tyrosyl-tRNA(Tyr) deacylase [Rikenellaceae bacterium]
MRILIQRVSQASVTVGAREQGTIGRGLLVLVGIEEADTMEDVEWLSQKLVKLRIFDDAAGMMNLDVREVGGEVLVVSQFTLHAQVRKGNRPSYIRAARPEHAVPLYGAFIAAVSRELGRVVPTGEFGAMMEVALANDGPVTIWIDSKNKE